MKKFIFAILLIIVINFAFSSKCTEKAPASGEKLKQADCKDLETSDKEKLKCVLNLLQNKCEEVNKVFEIDTSKLKKGVVITLIAVSCVVLVLFVLFLNCIF